MTRTQYSAALAAMLVLAVNMPAFAQGKDELPNGRPFQMLQEQIADIDATLAQQIADLQTQLTALEGRVDAVEQHNAVQDQLIGALQGAVVILEQRMTTAEGAIDNLEAWNAAQQALLLQLASRVNALQAQINSQGSSIGLLFQLHQAQQQHLDALQNNVNFLNGQNSQQNSQLFSLQNQLNQVKNDLAFTRNRLAQGCPAGQSIRQLFPTGQIICEMDSGQASQVVLAAGGATAGPFGGIASAVAVCPPPPMPLPGQLPSPFIAMGGGFSVPPSGFTILQSRPNGSNSWLVTVRNANPFAAGFTVFANCHRNAP